MLHVHVYIYIYICFAFGSPVHVSQSGMSIEMTSLPFTCSMIRLSQVLAASSLNPFKSTPPRDPEPLKT